VAGFALVNFIGPPILGAGRSEALAALFLGVMAGQLGLLAIWAVLGPQRWPARLPLTLTIALSLHAATLSGLLPLDVSESARREMLRSFLLVPLVFLAAQIPLWVLRFVFACRILPGGADPGPSVAPRQFGLQQMFLATAVFAGSLGLASLGLSDEAFTAADAGRWTGLLIGCGLCSVWSAFWTLPCLWAGLIARDKTASAMGMAAYVPVVSFFVVAVVDIFAGVINFATIMGQLLLFHGGLTGVMLGTFHAVRSRGYVLVRANLGNPLEPLPSSSASHDSSAVPSSENDPKPD
jgi:hypothetical protein